MKYKMKDLMKEKDQQKISVMLEGISKHLDELKTEFRSAKEQKIIDVVIGNNPAYMFLQPFLEKKKSMEEMLLGETDWSAIQTAIQESLAQKEIPLKDVIKETIKEYPKAESEEQQMVRLLEEIVNLLNKIINSQLEITNMLVSICKVLQSNNE